jgi:hypothetical protein
MLIDSQGCRNIAIVLVLFVERVRVKARSQLRRAPCHRSRYRVVLAQKKENSVYPIRPRCINGFSRRAQFPLFCVRTPFFHSAQSESNSLSSVGISSLEASRLRPMHRGAEASHGETAPAVLGGHSRGVRTRCPTDASIRRSVHRMCPHS